MSLVRLLYASTISDSFNADDIKQILASAQRNNAKENVTGMLTFDRHYFLQCLEGSRENVNAIYHRIASDSRHEKLEILDYQSVNFREFPNWNMGYLQNTGTLIKLFFKYNANGLFDPYHMTPEGAFMLLLEIRDEADNALKNNEG
ncbi:BLUF domain-containing protein [Marinomonas balearica]|uniref:FAD-dependent sensor of blue light n=1 Tax=Marinomonas balearica TaxID=491947 RepID=A0A4R6MDZ1_9GAMM|nr:BLUF domain-containing protein [Marinomonas balearica]TDO99435.1 FAD-dependent sensor of blue light [Marinomonas balearica]